MVVACLYSWRKYMHKLGYSKELKQRVDPSALERTESRLNKIRRKVTKGFLKTDKEVLDLAQRVVREEGVGRVVSIVVRRDQAGEIVLEVVPPNRYGRMSRWLHAHLYYGLFSGVLVWLHGAGSLESPLGLIMNALTLLVILTGVIGLFLFALGPTWITRRENTDVNFEDVYVLAESLDEKIAELREKFDEDSPLLGHVDRAAGAAPGKTAAVAKQELDHALVSEAGRSSEALLQDMMVLIGQRGRMRMSLRRLMRVRFWINIWRAIHVPASILLMAIVVGHIFSVWVY